MLVVTRWRDSPNSLHGVDENTEVVTYWLTTPKKWRVCRYACTIKFQNKFSVNKLLYFNCCNSHEQAWGVQYKTGFLNVKLYLVQCVCWLIKRPAASHWIGQEVSGGPVQCAGERPSHAITLKVLEIHACTNTHSDGKRNTFSGWSWQIAASRANRKQESVSSMSTHVTRMSTHL